MLRRPLPARDDGLEFCTWERRLGRRFLLACVRLWTGGEEGVGEGKIKSVARCNA